MTLLEHALALAEMGFHVFPLAHGGKLPAIKNYPEIATRDPEQIKFWWDEVFFEPNIGISTTKFLETYALVVVDVDEKGKKGSDTLFELELEGFEFPQTLTQVTPTGGQHLIYFHTEPVKQGVDVLGRGLDIRSRGGYIVGEGSIVNGMRYLMDYRGVTQKCPQWIVERCGRAPERDATQTKVLPGIDPERANHRAIHYLQFEAPQSVKGSGGDQTAYRVAARVKDLGVSREDALDLMMDHWFEGSGWEPEKLKAKIDHAYHYGLRPQGDAAPEAHFTPAAPASLESEKAEPTPVQRLNHEFAFVLTGGGHHVLWETTDVNGKFELKHVPEASFHKRFVARKLHFGDRPKALTEIWMTDPERRTFDGIVFKPGQKVDPRFYNLWRGFAVEPRHEELGTPTARKSLNMFLEHAKENVCHGDEGLFDWLIGYFAHLIQKPWEKPLVSLVFRGKKGVGKNALIDRVGHLLGCHYLLSASRRYLVGNFNGHLENCLLFVLDEAFWSGDKQAEGAIKDLITGNHHVIERKGQEAYQVDNCTRVVIIGNEDWLVPATHDERRFAVFDVGDGKKQDRGFFQEMREGMEAGGYSLLLRYLMDVDLSKIEVNAAPKTQGLLDQKLNSLEPFHQFWFSCLEDGRVHGMDFSEGWVTDLNKEGFRTAFRRYFKERNIRGRVPDDRAIGRMFKECLPAVDGSQKKREGSETVYVYRIPDLEGCRAAWAKFIGHEVSWK